MEGTRLLMATCLCGIMRVAAATIGVSPVDPHYFADDAGKTWIPVGCNMCFDRNANPSQQARELYDGWMTKFAANGGNFMRVWLSVPFVDVMPAKAYEFSDEATDNLKWLVGRAGQLGIRLKFTFENFRRLGPKVDADPAAGVISFMNTSYMPYAKNMYDVFASDKCFDIYLAKARHVAEAVGSSDALIAVELWNEITSVRMDGPSVSATAKGSCLDVIGAWSEKMLAELKRLYPGKMTLQNLGSFATAGSFRTYDWMAGLKGNDYMQVHRYLDPAASLDVCSGPMDVLCADAIRELRDRRDDCPAILAETGAVERGHKTFSHLYMLDSAGMLLHDEIFAAFFAGSAGSGQPWHWDHQYISQHGLWRHFRRFATAIDGLDPAAEHFRPFHAATRRLRIWGLKGRNTTVMWLRDKRNTWATELDKGLKPEPVEGEKMPPFFCRRKLDWYLPWADRRLTTDSAEIPAFVRSAVVRFATKED